MGTLFLLFLTKSSLLAETIAMRKLGVFNYFMVYYFQETSDRKSIRLLCYDILSPRKFQISSLSNDLEGF